MHPSAFKIGSRFLELNIQEPCVIIELGAQDVNGSLRVSRPGVFYVGVDFEHGRGVDLVVTPGEPTPLRDDFADITLSSSQLEHDSFFWNTFLEMVRLTKPGGLIYINAPSNGCYHSYPLDCWRFYPDSGISLERWARANNQDITLIESFIALQDGAEWSDCVMIFKKAIVTQPDDLHFLASEFDGRNVRQIGAGEVQMVQFKTEDQMLIERLEATNQKLRKQLEDLGASVGD